MLPLGGYTASARSRLGIDRSHGGSGLHAFDSRPSRALPSVSVPSLGRRGSQGSRRRDVDAAALSLYPLARHSSLARQSQQCHSRQVADCSGASFLRRAAALVLEPAFGACTACKVLLSGSSHKVLGRSGCAVHNTHATLRCIVHWSTRRPLPKSCMGTWMCLAGLSRSS